MDFPHIEDTSFPHLNNVDVYKYKNEFDYARWQGKATYKLLNVKWNSTCSDIPWFETDKERDEWFDEKDGYAGVLESVFNNTPETTLKVPIPFNVAYNYNYIVVDMPVQTSVDNQINYENVNARVERWYFFIEDMNQAAPNTTELELTIDYWTTFINQVEIPYLMLERGHAPMTKVDVDTYLTNPIMNNEYLLADDFNFGNDTIIQSSVYKPIGNGTKYVLFCAPYNQSDFSNFGGSAYSGTSTPPTFADNSNRWGKQIVVNGYEWKYGDSDYSNAQLPISNEITNGILNGCNCYAIEGQYAQAFFNECAKNCVNFIHGIRAMFILDDSLFTKGTGFSFRNKTIYPVLQKHSYETFSLNKTLFGFDTNYQSIAKLYTSPYSELELTDDDGNIFRAKIENCGEINLHTEVSIVYPFLNYNVFLSGINGDGTAAYTWKQINGNSSDMAIWASDFSKFMMNWKIPTYSIFVSSEDEYAANNFFGNQAKRAGAIKDYQNAVRYANTTYENTDDLEHVNEANAKRTNLANKDDAYGNATTSKSDSYNNAATAKSDANDSADTIKANTLDQGLVHKVNTECATKTSDYITNSVHNPKLHQVNDANNAKLLSDTNAANATAITITGAQNEMAAITNGYSQAANLGSAVVGGIGGVASVTNSDGMSIIGSLVGITKAEIGAISANAITTQVVATNQQVVNTQTAANSAYYTNAKTLNNVLNGSDADGITGFIEIENSATTLAQNKNAARQAENNYNLLAGGNAETPNFPGSGTVETVYGTAKRTNETAHTISQRDYDNTTDIADRDYNNAIAIADRDKLAADTNATDLRSTLIQNADYTRDAIIVAEKANLVQKQLEVENTYKNARLQTPHQQGEYSGDYLPDVYKRRGIRLNVRTQSKSAIAQAGDAMLRFGYALHRTWDMSLGLHYGNHFTFWRAEDIWINDGDGVANVATNAIASIFMQGVTVWRDPDEIGRVSIYDNF